MKLHCWYGMFFIDHQNPGPRLFSSSKNALYCLMPKGCPKDGVLLKVPHPSLSMWWLPLPCGGFEWSQKPRCGWLSGPRPLSHDQDLMTSRCLQCCCSVEAHLACNASPCGGQQLQISSMTMANRNNTICNGQLQW